MINAVPTPTFPVELEAYETAFQHGLRHSSRALVTDPWTAGVVHVFRNLPAQPEPIVTPGIDLYQVLLLNTDTVAREYYDARPPHIDGLLSAGRLNLYPPAVARERTFTSWTSEQHESIGFMLPHATLAAAATAFGQDYDTIKFTAHYNVADPLLAGIARALGSELETGAPGGRVYGEQLLHTAALHLLHRYSVGSRTVQRTGGLPPQALRRVRDYALAHLSDTELSLADLADAAGYSLWHFARALRAATGETPAALVWRLRMEEAAQLLSTQPRPTVAMVAKAVGYGSATGFSRAFRRRWGVGPGRWGK